MKRSIHYLAAVAALALIPSLASASHLPVAGSASTATHFAAAAAGQDTGDAALTAKIKAAIAADADVKDTTVDITAASGVVTLAGSVSSPVLRVTIFNITRSTEGVTKIVNKIKLAKQ